MRKSRVIAVVPGGAKRNYELLALLKDPSPKLRMTEAGYLKYIDWPEGGAVMPEERKSFEQRAQNIILKDRRRLMISGVRHVESFNEDCIVLDTELGILVVRGIGMHINKLNVETSELDVEGDIIACEYVDNGGNQRKGGFFSGLFR